MRLSYMDNFEKSMLFSEFKDLLIREMFELTTSDGNPVVNQMAEKFRNLEALQWNTKVLGSELASFHYKNSNNQIRPAKFDMFSLSWAACRYDDFVQKWFIDTCSQLRISPILHRKIWEEIYIINVLKNRGMLKPGMRGIVFGVGLERLPAYFGSLGVEILATDLAPNNSSSQSWINTNQHGSLSNLYFQELISKSMFDNQISFEFADMNNIPNEWNGLFDFCWSTCALEHLGSISNGSNFIFNTGKLLKKGGVSVHTTEFNYTNNEETIDNWPTVLFRKKDIDNIANKLLASGYEIPDINYDVGNTPVDRFIDIPPFPHHDSYYDSSMNSLHLKLLVDGFPCTCFGINFVKKN